MGDFLSIMIYVVLGLFVACTVFVIVKTFVDTSKAQAKEEPVAPKAEAKVAEEPAVEEPVKEEVKEEPAPVVKEEVKQEPVKEEAKQEEKPAEPVVEQEVVATSDDEEDEESEDEEAGEDAEGNKLVIERRPFAEKLLSSTEENKNFYNEINNNFLAYKKIHARVSQKGVSYRFGRELVAKLNLHGKTIKLFLALGIEDFNQNLYFQKDMSEKKQYEEVPFMVKVKSNRALDRSKELIYALMEKNGVEPKARFNTVDSIALLQEKVSE